MNVVSKKCSLKWTGLNSTSPKWMRSQINVVSNERVTNEQVSNQRGLKRTWSQMNWSQLSAHRMYSMRPFLGKEKPAKQSTDWQNASRLVTEQETRLFYETDRKLEFCVKPADLARHHEHENGLESFTATYTLAASSSSAAKNFVREGPVNDVVSPELARKISIGGITFAQVGTTMKIW